MDFPIPFWAGWCCLHNLQRQPLPDLTCRVIKVLFFFRCWRFYYLSNEFQNHVWLVLKGSFGLSKAQNFKSTGQCTSLFCWGFPAHDCAHESPCPVWGYRPFQSFQLYQTTDFSHLPFLWVSVYLQSYSEKCPLCTASPFSLQGHPWQWCNLYMQQRNHGGCRSEVGSAGDPLAGNTTKPKEKKISSEQQFPGNTNAVTWCVNTFNLTININLRMTSAKVGCKDKALRTVI